MACLSKQCVSLSCSQVGRDKLALHELNKGISVYSQAEGQGAPSKPFFMIIITKQWKTSQGNRFQHAVRIGFLPATLRRRNQSFISPCAVLCLVAQSCLTLCEPIDCNLPGSSVHGDSPWGFSRQEYWSGLPCPPAGDLPNPGIEHRSLALQVNSLPAELPGKPLCCHSTEQNYFLKRNKKNKSKAYFSFICIGIT